MAIFLIDGQGVTHPTAAIWSQFGISAEPKPQTSTPTNLTSDLGPRANDLEAFETLAAQDLMTCPVITLSADCPLCDALDLFSKHHFRHLPIVSNLGHVCGIISERDLIAWMNQNAQAKLADLLAQPVSTLMVTQVLVVTPDTPSETVLALMRYRAIGSLPVVQTGVSHTANLLGIITKSDVLAHFCPPSEAI